MAAGAVEVLVVAEQLRRRPPGGIGTYCTGLIGGLARLAAAGELGRVAPHLYASRVTGPDPLGSFDLPWSTSRLSGRTAVPAWDHGLARAPRTAAVVHQVSFAGPRPTVPTVPTVVTVYDLAWRRLPDAFPARGRRWHEARLARALRSGAHLVVPSAETRDDLCHAGAAPERVTVIAGAPGELPAPDEAATAALVEREGAGEGFVLTVGTLEPRKNLARLVAGYALARERLDGRVPLLVVGPTGWGAMPGELPEGVRLIGPVAPGVLAGLYARARAVCYVPLFEGFGLPVLEAMVAGAPVVSSAVPTAGGATRLVDPLDVESIADGLVAVAGGGSVAGRLRDLGRAHVAGYSWDATARAHRDLWTSLAPLR